MKYHRNKSSNKRWTFKTVSKIWNRRKRLGVLLAFFLTFNGTFLIKEALAHENVFGFMYTTETLPKGEWELEQVYQGKYGKNHGSYANSFFRTELEYGFTDNFQGSVYINSRSVHANKNNPDGTTGGEDVPDDADPNKNFSEYKFETVSFEGIYRLLSPYKDPFGLAIYLEPAVGPDQYEVEPKLFFQKNFLEDRLIVALNMAWEMEWARNKEGEDNGVEQFEWEHEMESQNTLGASYRLVDHWRGGVEFLNVNKFGTFSLRDIEHNAYFLGPNLHFANQAFWTTAAVLFQLPWARGHSEEQRDAIEGGRIFGHEQEALRVNVKMGWNF